MARARNSAASAGSIGFRGLDERTHRIRILRELDGFLDYFGGARPRERLEIGDEVVLPRKVFLGLLVVSADDSVVRPLEETGFYILAEFEARHLLRPRWQVFERGHGSDDGTRNVVFPLALFSGHEVLTQFESPAHAVGVAADPEIRTLDWPAVVLENIARGPVDRIHGEALYPAIGPFRVVEPFDEEDEGFYPFGDGFQPGIVFLRVEGRGSNRLKQG